MKRLKQQILRFKYRPSHARRGQAISEYSLILVLLTVGAMGTIFEFLPRFITAFQRYFDSFYMMINLPIP